MPKTFMVTAPKTEHDQTKTLTPYHQPVQSPANAFIRLTQRRSAGQRWCAVDGLGLHNRLFCAAGSASGHDAGSAWRRLATHRHDGVDGDLLTSARRPGQQA